VEVLMDIVAEAIEIIKKDRVLSLGMFRAKFPNRNKHHDGQNYREIISRAGLKHRAVISSRNLVGEDLLEVADQMHGMIGFYTSNGDNHYFCSDERDVFIIKMTFG
jgi:hypothetical protein